MAEPSLMTRTLDTLLPRRFTPLHRLVSKLLKENLLHSREAESWLRQVERFGLGYPEAVRKEDPGLVPAAEARKETVISDARAAHGAFRRSVHERQALLLAVAAGSYRDLVKPGEAEREKHSSLAKLQETARAGGRVRTALVYAVLHENRERATKAERTFSRFMYGQGRLVHPDPQFRSGEPLVPLTAGSPETAPASAGAPRPRAALRDGTGRTPARTTGRATVRPAARRERSAPGPRRGPRT